MTGNLTVNDTPDNQPMLARYRRAQMIEHGFDNNSLVLNTCIYPKWIGDTDCFWYIRKCRKGDGATEYTTKEFRLVNAEAATNVMAFDHKILAQALSAAVKKVVNPDDLPINLLNLELSPCRVTFMAFDQCWNFDASTTSCEAVAFNPSNWLVSPDGKKAAFLRDYNLWIHDLDNGEEYALTQDGERHYAYATQPERVNQISGFSDSAWVNSMTPEALWSADSKHLLTVRVDERKVLSLPTTQYVPTDGSVRPRSIQTKYALPGDEHIVEYEVLAIDVETRSMCRAQYSNVPDAVLWAGLFSGNRAWWSSDSRYAYFVDMARGQQHAKVVEFAVQTGATRILFEERSSTHIDLALEFETSAFLRPLPETQELIWFSERSGWAHLYLYDLTTGEQKHAITHGDWLVREILHVDSKRRELWLQVAGRVAGRDPYYREICRLNIDTGEITTLASGDHDYIVYHPTCFIIEALSSFGGAAKNCSGVSPSGRYIVTTQSRVDEVPVTHLIDRGGNRLLTVETANCTGLPNGWQWPEPVKLVAADGETDTYGVVFRPTDFSPDKKYPVLNWVFNNAHYAAVPKGAFGNDPALGFMYMPAMAYAELGFIVVIIDGRGSCFRSKAFHDHAYGKMHLGSNLEDQIAGIRQLAERYPYMDLDRVGITDNGGSNAPVYGLLAHPDFYKVGTVCSIWDVRLLTHSETYQGLLSDADYQQSVLGEMAGNLRGKLLLIQGMQDSFYHPSGYLQLIDALVRENCDFDMLLIPNCGHAWSSSHYGTRRMWDYLVTHLLGETPPSRFRLSNGLEHTYTPLLPESE